VKNRLLLVLGFSICLVLSSLGCKSSVVKYTNTAQINANGIVLTISTNKAVYKSGELVIVNATVENQSENTFEYTSGLENFLPAIYLEDNPYFNGFALWEKELQHDFSMAGGIITKQLKPHEIHKRRVIWDQKFDQKRHIAPQGEYSISCGITKATNIIVSVDIHIQIAGAQKWITQEQAKDIALSVSEVRAWLDQHTGDNIIKEENGNYFVCFHEEWQQVSPQFTITETETLNLSDLQEWTPEVYVLLDNSQWIVRTGTKLGMNPHFIKITIDPVTGSILNTDFSDYYR
jgi:hypothetical protein